MLATALHQLTAHPSFGVHWGILEPLFSPWDLGIGKDTLRRMKPISSVWESASVWWLKLLFASFPETAITGETVKNLTGHNIRDYLSLGGSQFMPAKELTSAERNTDCSAMPCCVYSCAASSVDKYRNCLAVQDFTDTRHRYASPVTVWGCEWTQEAVPSYHLRWDSCLRFIYYLFVQSVFCISWVFFVSL